MAVLAAVRVRREPLAVVLVTIVPLADPVATTIVLLGARGLPVALAVVRHRAAIVSLRAAMRANALIDHHEDPAPMAPVGRCEAAAHAVTARIVRSARIVRIAPSAPTVRIETVRIAPVARDRTRLGARTGARRLVPTEPADPTGAPLVIVPFAASAARIDSIDPIAAPAPNAAIVRIAAIDRIDSIDRIAAIDHGAPAAGEKTGMPGSRAALGPNAATGPTAVTGPTVLPVPEVALDARRRRAAAGAVHRARARAVVQAPRHGPVVTEHGLQGRVAS